jgi:hypothetical protein
MSSKSYPSSSTFTNCKSQVIHRIFDVDKAKTISPVNIVLGII